MYMCKFIYLFTCLTMCLMSSCVSHKLHFDSSCHNMEIAENSLRIGEKTFLKADLYAIDLKAKRLAFCCDSISVKKQDYLKQILKDCNSNNDTIIAFSYDFVVLKSSKNENNSSNHYLYYYDIDREQWVCQYKGESAIDIEPFSDIFLFQREVYMTKKRNRVMIKDSFDTFSIIYVIQGRDSSTDFFTTKVWNPVDFNSFITTSNYIIDRINPVSYNISKNVFLLKRESEL